MSNVSKEKRDKQRVYEQLQKHGRDINVLKDEVRKLQKQYDEHSIMHILDDIDKETFTGSGRPLFTYENIAKKYGTSPSTVSRIAEENGRSRRGKRTI
jgi:hypothetical protein